MVIKDMSLISRLKPYTSPEEIPLSFVYGDRKITGIPAEFSPSVRYFSSDTNITTTIIEGTDKNGLTIRAEYKEYHDYPVTEWVAYFTNNGSENTAIISDIKIIDSDFGGENPVFVHGNGETRRPDGFGTTEETLETGKQLVSEPKEGTSMSNASPYMELRFDDYKIKIGIGWPAEWKTTVEKNESGAHITIGQRICHMYIKPGETMRTPRVNLMGCRDNGINLWRRWYFAHILPRDNGDPVPPMLCLHVFQDGGPEFTATTTEHQIDGINKYLKHGLKPDIWWVDAGWYKCGGNWGNVGTWEHDETRFPGGLGAIGDKCAENGIRFLLWFEPERVMCGTKLETEHPEWMLRINGPTCLLNLSLPEVQDWLINEIDGLIKKYHVTIYRQDFNTNADLFFRAAETEDRLGAIENLHVQGYLRYWDELRRRNPGLYMDSCASGGRRNDLETMRRAVTLHYTDYGYGNHLVKQRQHRYMFEWIPYFRAHNQNTCDEFGVYDRKMMPVDRFSYENAMAPSMTDMIDRNETDERFALALEMNKIWRRAADFMMHGDYYPLTECRLHTEDWYAMQFENDTTGKGFIQLIRNVKSEDESFTAKMHADGDFRYIFENSDTGDIFELDGEDIVKNGFTASLPKYTGVIWFYTKIKK